MSTRAAVLFAVVLLAACAGPAAGPSASPASSPSPAPAAADAAPTAAHTAPPSPVRAGLTPATVTRVIDGDTIEVRIEGRVFKLRYIGIDTPETVDPRRPVGCFGKEASERNRQLVQGRTVGLEKDVSESDAFGRLLRYVWAGEAMVNATLVEEGFALASSYPPDVRYQELFSALQAEAREEGRGLWGDACASPTAAAPPGQGAACDYSDGSRSVIKGNVSASTGEKIYHVPGGEYYDATVIDESKGERWFCTEAEAEAAGWRRSRR